MDRKAFFHLLAPLRRRLLAEAFVRRFLQCLAFFGGVLFFITLLSWWVWIDRLPLYYLACLFGAFLSAVLLVGLADRIDYEKTAAACDAMGFSERFITACEILEHGTKSKMEELAVSDAFQAGRKEPLAKRYGFHFPARLAVAAACLLLAAAFCGFSRPENTVMEKMGETLQALQEEKKLLEKDQTIDKKLLSELTKELSSLKKELGKAKSDAEALSAMAKTQEALKKIEKKSVKEDLRALSEKLSALEAGQKLLEGGADAAKAMEALLNQAENMSQEEFSKLLTALSEAAEAMTDAELSELLEKLASELGNGTLDQKTAEQLANKLSGMLSENAALRNGVAQMNQTLSKSANALGKPLQPASQGQGTQTENGQKQGQGEGNGQGEENGQGEGQSQGQGNGQGNGQGKGNGSGRGLSHAESEQVFSRDAESMAGYETQVSGQQNEGGQSTVTEGRGEGQRGQSLPYQEVVNSYRQEALSDMENETVPYGVKQLVEEYFSTLEQ